MYVDPIRGQVSRFPVGQRRELRSSIDPAKITWAAIAMAVQIASNLRSEINSSGCDRCSIVSSNR